MMLLLAWAMSVAVTVSSVNDIVPPYFKDRHRHIVHVNWNNITMVAQTTATLQVVSNPILDTKYSPITPTLFDNLAALQADLVRYAAWYPYPLVGVAELEPPDARSKTTSWKFGDELQQQFLDVWESVVATGGKRLVITFSTQPAWMFNTTDWRYSNDTSRSDWHYAKGGTWMPATTQLVADYYARLASWMVKGELEDEFGNIVGGGPKLGLGSNDGGGVTHWEIFNEPEAEHHLTPHQYNLLYDAIVKAIRQAIDPDRTIQFFGMALSGHNEWNWWQTFLNPDNHDEEGKDALANGYASFHFYASPSSRTNVSTYSEVWTQVDAFLDEVDQIIALRDDLSPTTKLAINELGVIPKQDNVKGVPDVPPIYFNMVAAVYTGILLILSARGVDLVGSSQYCGCPDIPEWGIPDRQYPGVSMTNWTTGSGNPRYWALKMLNEKVGVGDNIVFSSIEVPKNSDGRRPDVIAQGRISAQGVTMVILVNKSEKKQLVTLPEIEEYATGATYHVNVVDERSHDGPWGEYDLVQRPWVILHGFAVAVIEVLKEEEIDIL